MNTSTIGGIPKGRLAVIAIILALLMAAAYGFAAANTVDTSSAGIGDNTISGYTVDDVAYTLAANSENLSAVDFTLTPAAGGSAAETVKAKTYDGGTYVNCSETVAVDGETWTCPVTDTVEQAVNLTVVATGSSNQS